MRAVLVGIWKDYNLVIVQIFYGEILPYTRSKRADYRADFFVLQNFIKAFFLRIQRFTAQWKNGLVLYQLKLKQKLECLC